MLETLLRMKLETGGNEWNLTMQNFETETLIKKRITSGKREN
jgi:hypothetical protein